MADGRPARHAKGHGGDAVDHCLRSGRTQAGCAADLGIPKRTLGRWARARRPAWPRRAKVEETRELRKEAGRLRTENEFPKEAAALLPASQAQARGCDWRARRGRAPRPDGVPAAGRAAIQLLRLAGARARRRPEGAARARPDAPRPPKPSPHHQAGRRRSPPEDRTGMALHGCGGRPARAWRRSRPSQGARRPTCRSPRSGRPGGAAASRSARSLARTAAASTHPRRWPTGRRRTT